MAPRGSAPRQGVKWASLFAPGEAEAALMAARGSGPGGATPAPAAGDGPPSGLQQQRRSAPDMTLAGGSPPAGLQQRSPAVPGDDGDAADLPTLPDSASDGDPPSGASQREDRIDTPPAAVGLGGLLSLFNRPRPSGDQGKRKSAPSGGLPFPPPLAGSGRPSATSPTNQVTAAMESAITCMPASAANLPLPSDPRPSGGAASPSSSTTSPREVRPYLLGGTAAVLAANERMGVEAAPPQAVAAVPRGKFKIWRPNGGAMPPPLPLPTAPLHPLDAPPPPLHDAAPDIPAAFLRPLKPRRFKRSSATGGSETPVGDIEEIHPESAAGASRSAPKHGSGHIG